MVIEKRCRADIYHSSILELSEHSFIVENGAMDGIAVCDRKLYAGGRKDYKEMSLRCVACVFSVRFCLFCEYGNMVSTSLDG